MTDGSVNDEAGQAVRPACRYLYASTGSRPRPATDGGDDSPVCEPGVECVKKTFYGPVFDSTERRMSHLQQIIRSAGRKHAQKSPAARKHGRPRIGDTFPVGSVEPLSRLRRQLPFMGALIVSTVPHLKGEVSAKRMEGFINEEFGGTNLWPTNSCQNRLQQMAVGPARRVGSADQ